jgi:hypothetical protein
MLSRREKNIIKSIDVMFQGMDDDELKEIILATSLQKADLEKERIVEIINKKKEEDLKYINEKFEIEINNKEPLKMLELFKTFVEQNPQMVQELEQKADEEEDKNIILQTFGVPSEKE